MQRKKIKNMIEKYNGIVDIVHLKTIFFHYSKGKYAVSYDDDAKLYHLAKDYRGKILIQKMEYKKFIIEFKKFLED